METGVSWFRLASGAVHVSVNRIGSPEPIVVSSSSASSAECTGSPYVHWDWDIIHAARRVGGVESVWVLLVIERPVWIALEVLLEIGERAAAESSRLELWAGNVGRVTTLLFQYVVKEFLAPSDLYSSLFQFGEVAGLWSLDDIL